MKLCRQKLQGVANALMYCGDVRGFLLVRDMIFCGFSLECGKEFESHSNFSGLFDFGNMV